MEELNQLIKAKQMKLRDNCAQVFTEKFNTFLYEQAMEKVAQARLSNDGLQCWKLCQEVDALTTQMIPYHTQKNTIVEQLFTLLQKWQFEKAMKRIVFALPPFHPIRQTIVVPSKYKSLEREECVEKLEDHLDLPEVWRTGAPVRSLESLFRLQIKYGSYGRACNTIERFPLEDSQKRTRAIMMLLRALLEINVKSPLIERLVSCVQDVELRQKCLLSLFEEALSDEKFSRAKKIISMVPPDQIGFELQLWNKLIKKCIDLEEWNEAIQSIENLKSFSMQALKDAETLSILLRLMEALDDRNPLNQPVVLDCENSEFIINPKKASRKVDFSKESCSEFSGNDDTTFTTLYNLIQGQQFRKAAERIVFELSAFDLQQKETFTNKCERLQCEEHVEELEALLQSSEAWITGPPSQRLENLCKLQVKHKRYREAYDTIGCFPLESSERKKRMIRTLFHALIEENDWFAFTRNLVNCVQDVSEKCQYLQDLFRKALSCRAFSEVQEIISMVPLEQIILKLQLWNELIRKCIDLKEWDEAENAAMQAIKNFSSFSLQQLRNAEIFNTLCSLVKELAHVERFDEAEEIVLELPKDSAERKEACNALCKIFRRRSEHGRAKKLKDALDDSSTPESFTSISGIPPFAPSWLQS